ncbi:MAG: hypothetical protein AB7V26_03415 [Lysobacterales bacterium]
MQKGHGKSADSDRGNGATKPRLPVESGVQSATYSKCRDGHGEHLAENALYENIPVQTRFSGTTKIRLSPGLLNYKIDQIRAKRVQKFQLCYRKYR